MSAPDWMRGAVSPIAASESERAAILILQAAAMRILDQADTALAVLAEAGLQETDIQALRAAGAIAP